MFGVADAAEILSGNVTGKISATHGFGRFATGACGRIFL